MENYPVETKTSINIDKKDIVDVALAKIESTLLIEINNLKKEVTALEKQLSDIHKEIEKEVYDVSYASVEDGFLLLKDAILFFNMKENPFSIKGVVEPTYQGDYPEKIFVSVHFQHKATIFSKSVNITKKIVEELYPRRDLISKEIADKKEKTIDIRRKLNRLPEIERQIKARVIEAELNKTEIGKQILSQLDELYLNNLVKQLCE